MITKTINSLKLKLYLYEPSKELYIKKRPLILVIPGGGYSFVSDREADPIALRFLGLGYNTAILSYSVAGDNVVYPTQYFEAFAALKYIIDNSEELGVDPDRIVVNGYSAGAHLAAMVGTGAQDELVLKHFNVDKGFFRPAGMILAYPVITSGEYAHRGSFDCLLGEMKNDAEMLSTVSIEKRVDGNTCPAFIWHTFTDGTVPVRNSLLLANALEENHIPFEMHIFPMGGHGLSLGNELTTDARKGGRCDYVSSWITMCEKWLNHILGDFII